MRNLTKFTFEIDYDLMDKITVENLADYEDSLKQSLDKHFTKGDWMHPEDINHAKEMIKAIKFVLKDFGVENGEDTNTYKETT